jgi:hypothetical protein
MWFQSILLIFCTFSSITLISAIRKSLIIRNIQCDLSKQHFYSNSSCKLNRDSAINVKVYFNEPIDFAMVRTDSLQKSLENKFEFSVGDWASDESWSRLLSCPLCSTNSCMSNSKPHGHGGFILYNIVVEVLKQSGADILHSCPYEVNYSNSLANFTTIFDYL